MTDDRAMELFFELYSGLPRQGPGDADSTRRALSLVPPLDSTARILDVGCGTGAQTFDLARFSPATILAVDLHPPFVEELTARAAALGLTNRVEGRVGDMHQLDLSSQSFDLIWCEGAVYFMGLEAALEAWRELLKPRGHVGVSELCWLEPERPEECVRYFESEYPQMRDIEQKRSEIERSGYELIGDFPVPDSAWWHEYYEPLSRNLADFRDRHTSDSAASPVAEETAREIEMFRKYNDYYGYVFFVMRRPAD